MIRGFKDRITETVFTVKARKDSPDLVKIALRKLGYLDAALDLRDLRVPPGNHLEALSKDRQGQHPIRINDQFRICFRRTPQGPADVEITDYH